MDYFKNTMTERYKMNQAHKKNPEYISWNEFIQRDMKPPMDEMSDVASSIVLCNTHSNSSYDSQFSTNDILKRSLEDMVPNNRWKNCELGRLLDHDSKLLEIISQRSEETISIVSGYTDFDITDSSLLEDASLSSDTKAIGICKATQTDMTSDNTQNQVCFAMNIMIKRLNEPISAIDEERSQVEEELNHIHNEILVIQKITTDIQTKFTDFESPSLMETCTNMKTDLKNILDTLKLRK